MNRQVHSIAYRVPYADTDQMAVVYYANYFIYFERIRNEIIRQGGHSYRQIEELGFLFPVIEAHARYDSPARYDDELTIKGWFESGQGSTFRMEYTIERDTEELVHGYTVHCVINREGKVRRLPDFLRAQIPIRS
ncbi:MAG: acyl-CoA thioesterase [Spirochaetales bacterium]|nr:acyl-CoA thioesterase [Spirochaetales bacterium]